MTREEQFMELGLINVADICEGALTNKRDRNKVVPKGAAWPCGLSIEGRIPEAAIGQMARVHIRHHELGHTKSPWQIMVTSHYDNEEDPTELTSTHMTCSDMEG